MLYNDHKRIIKSYKFILAKMEFGENKGFEGLSEKERRQKIRSNQEELARRKEQGAIDPVDYEPNYLYYLCQDGTAVENRDLKKFAQHLNGQAVNISQADLLYIKELTGNNLKIVLANGTICEIDPETMGYGKNDRLIIFPEELGNKNPGS